MRISTLPVTLALTLVAGCGPHVVSTPAPVPATGSRIRYAARSDTTEMVPARLVSLDADSLVFERFVPGDFGGKWVPGSLPTDSVARVQVRVGRRGNAGRGALIGGVVGLALGVACASEEPGWFQPTPEECLVFYTISGAGTGLLIGALVRSDVWAPTALPSQRPAPAPEPMVSAAPVGVGIRLPIRIASPPADP
ncbi:MAG TPA: hypothetical protein VFT84_09110 [Gemmatimonadales bacterium]|nr:hypothetical protein [Gemmatimonadales bacterium]